MRGRRVALLLTGLWPLLAKDDVPASQNNVTINADENDVLPLAPPKLPLDLLTETTSNPSNIVMVEHAFNTDVIDALVVVESDIINDQHVEQHETRDLRAEPPEPISSDEQENDETKEVLATPSQDGPDTNASEASPQVQAGSPEEDSEFPESISDVDAAEPESSTDTAKEEGSDESASTQAQEGEAAETPEESPTDEDEDVGTDRLLVDYASKSAGALILEKSPSMKGTSNLLNGDNDKYAIAPCADKKFVVIGLSEDILVKQVKLANYERYSSHLKDVQIMGSQTMGDWVDLGTYTAEPGNGEQAFDLEEPSWARYLKFRFLSHHGSEHYCTYSQIKVHGSTMLQGFHEQWDSQENLDESDGSQDAAVDTDATEPGEQPGEVEGDGNDSTSEEGELSPEAESSVHTEQGRGDDTSGDTSDGEVDGSQSGTAVKTDSGENADTANDDTSGDSDDSRVTDTTNKEVDRIASPKEDSPANEPAHEKKPEADRTGSIGKADEGTPDDQKPTLSSASIDISSHDAVTSELTGSMEQLDTSAIKPADKSLKEVVASVVKEMVAAEALMTVRDAQTVSSVVKDIQESLKTVASSPGLAKIGAKIGAPAAADKIVEKAEPVPEEQAESTVKAAADIPEKGSDAVDESDISKPEDSSIEETAAHAEVDASSTEGSPAAKGDAQDSVADTSRQEKGEQTKTRATEPVAIEHAEKNDGAGLDPALAKVVARFPSAACMDGLDYQDFKAKIVAARKANAQASHHPGHTGKMEPIFKLLTDEIKALQTSQSVQDQYMKALISCYQKVMFEMADTLVQVETQQEKRLSDLEEAMSAVRTGLFTRMVVAVVGLISTCMFSAQLLFKAIAASLETLVALGFADDTTATFLVLGACSLGVLAIGYFACAIRSKNPKRLPRTENISMTNHTEKRMEPQEASSKAPERAPDIKTMPTKFIKLSATSDNVQSENGSDTSDPATVPVIALVPRQEKRPAHKNAPDLVPME